MCLPDLNPVPPRAVGQAQGGCCLPASIEMSVATRTRRIVLFPYGQPRNASHRDDCARFFLAMGGDIARVIDEPSGALDQFAAHLRRIEAIAEGMERPIVVLTATNPLVLTVIAARRRLEVAVPALRDATWVVFLDPEQDPFFVSTARAMGAFSASPSGAVTWTSPDNNEYLVATPQGAELDEAGTGAGRGDCALEHVEIQVSSPPRQSLGRIKPTARSGRFRIAESRRYTQSGGGGPRTIGVKSFSL